MLITSLEEMEKIVRSRGDLEWDGYNVVKYVSSNNALYKIDGAFHDGQWMKTVVFPLTEEGWNLPNYIGREDVQVEG